MEEFFKKLLGGATDWTNLKQFDGTEYSKVAIGDRISFKRHQLVRYIVSVETKKPIDTVDKPLNDSLKSYFLCGDGILGDILDEPVAYKCGFCNHPHNANAIIYYPTIGQKYYVDLKDICLLNESGYQDPKVVFND